MQKHHSCLNTRAIIEYFQEKLPERLPELLEGLGPEIDALANPQEFLMEINNWVSSDVVIRLFANAKRICDKDDIAFDIGFLSAARKKLGYVQRIIMFAHKNPRRTLKRVQAINDKFNRNKNIEIVETKRDRATIRLHWFKEIPGTRDFCLFNQGIYTGIPTIWNLPPAQVEETKCFFKGDDCCEYHFTWLKRSFFREYFLRFLIPWSVLKSTFQELEQDKELLKRKFDEVHRLSLQLKKQIDQLLCLQQTSRASLSILNLEKLLEVSLDLLLKFSDLDRALILIVDEKQKVLKLKYAAGFHPEMLAGIRGHKISLGNREDVIARAVSRNDPEIIPDITREGLGLSPLLQQIKPKACILAPLQVHQRLIGVLLVDRQQQEAAFTDADKEFMVSFSNQLAIALDKALLYRKLELSERKYRELVENAHEGIWIVDEHGGINFANRRMKEITGAAQLEGEKIYDFGHRDNRIILEKALSQNRSGKVAQEELEISSKDRGPRAVIMSSVPLMENGRFLGAFAMFSDVTEIKEMEKHLMQQQKMEAIGTLAGGIAHNFNNILMNIMGLTGLLLAHTDGADPVYADLQQIEEEVLKGSELTKHLLSMGQGGKFTSRPININTLIEKTARLFGRTRSDMVISRNLCPDLPVVEVDPGQMEQVLLNLFVNAWQAMSGAGEMVLSTRKVVLEVDFCQPYERPPGPYVHIAIADSGVGMDEATTARVFEPFFTTKKIGQGTGLGLATAYAIIKNHQGIIRVDSIPGRGTTFHIYLPVSEKPILPEKSSSYQFTKGTGTLLLVDDEESIRSVGKRILEQLGYRIFLAEDGPRAISLYQRKKDLIDLVILDMIMPGMGGKQTYERLKEINPRVKVLLSSGYSMNGEAQQVMDDGAQGFIQKPYRIEALSRKIAEMLGQRETSPGSGLSPG